MILSDLVMLITDLTSDSSIMGDKITNFKKGFDKASSVRGRQSIKNKAKNLILQYPVLSSNSISSDVIQTVSRALEHEYVNILSVLINSEIQREIVDEKDAEVSTYLKKFHTNIFKANSMQENVSISEFTKANQYLLSSFEESLNLENLNNTSFPTSILNEAGYKEKNNTVGIDTSKLDVKKLNDMTPTLVKATIKVKIGDTVTDKQISFGVKTVIHPMQSEDMIYYLSDAARDSSKFFRLIQWTTGEIKFFRDLIVTLDTVKKTALSSQKKDSFWWRKLQSMSKDTLIRRLLNLSGKKGEPIPTTTMIISKQDVDTIKNRYSVDLLNNTKHTMTIINKFFLLGFVIVDESTNIVYLYNEVSNDFDYYTLNALKSFGKDDTTDMDITKTLMKGR